MREMHVEYRHQAMSNSHRNSRNRYGVLVAIVWLVFYFIPDLQSCLCLNDYVTSV